jgi:Family of unknown function (DUF6334)
MSKISNFHLISGKKITNIFGVNQRVSSDGAQVFDSVQLWSDNVLLQIGLNNDTDEVVTNVTLGLDLPAPRGEAIDDLKCYMGAELGWSWMATNSQGYQDLIIFSFNGIDPDIGFLGEGSALILYYMGPKKFGL